MAATPVRVSGPAEVAPAGDFRGSPDYRRALELAGGKPMGLGEVARFPDPRTLAAQPAWAFVMGWADLAFESNSPKRLRALAADPRTMLREDMPGWDKLIES